MDGAELPARRAVGVARDEVPGQVILHNKVPEGIVPIVEGRHRTANLQVRIAFHNGWGCVLVDVEVFLHRTEEEHRAAVGLVPYLYIFVAEVKLFPVFSPVTVNLRPDVPIARHIAVVAIVDDAGTIAMRDDERLRVLSHSPEQIVVGCEVVGPIVLRTADGRFAVCIVVTPAHLVAHGAGFQLSQFGQVAVKLCASYPRRLIRSELLDQRMFLPCGEIHRNLCEDQVQRFIALNAIETAVKIVTSEIILCPDRHHVVALGEKSLLRVGQLLESGIVPLVAPTHNLHAVDVDSSLVIVTASQPDLTLRDVLREGEVPSEPEIVFPVVSCTFQSHRSRSFRSADVAYGTLARLPTRIIEVKRGPGSARGP